MKKRIIITGATSGIGFETLKKLAAGDYEVITASRNMKKAQRVLDEIYGMFPDADISSYELDLSSFESIENFSAKMHTDYDYIDILFNNAGLFLGDKDHTLQGFEMTIGVNYIGTYYLTYLLSDLLEKGHSPQIIHTNSRAALFGHLTYKEGRLYDHPRGFRSYAASKYMQMLWVKLKAAEFAEKGIRMNAIHPGDVMTDLWRTKNILIKLIWPFLKPTLISAQEGALPGMYLIEHDDDDTYGKLYQNLGEEMRFDKYDKNKAQRLVNETERELSKHISH